jgi:acetyltransferase-like isoleucine patch superfamily enzyme
MHNLATINSGFGHPLIRRIFHRAYRRFAVRKNVVIGKNVHIGLGSIISATRRLTIADDVHIGKYCTIACDGTIGRWTAIANNVGIIGRSDHNHRQVGTPIRWATHVEERKQIPEDVVEVQEDVWIGFGAIILSGVTVGRGSVVAAGAVVTLDVRPYTIVSGNPAKVVWSRFTKAEIAAHEAALTELSPDLPALN